MHHHGALGAKFLTAKATDAFLAVDHRLFVFDHDGRGGADVFAKAASHAVTLAKSGLRAEGGGKESSLQAVEEGLAVSRKL